MVIKERFLCLLWVVMVTWCHVVFAQVESNTCLICRSDDSEENVIYPFQCQSCNDYPSGHPIHGSCFSRYLSVNIPLIAPHLPSGPLVNLPYVASYSLKCPYCKASIKDISVTHIIKQREILADHCIDGIIQRQLLCFDRGGSIFIASGKTLTLKNMSIGNVRNGCFVFEDDTSCLFLTNVTIELYEDCYLKGQVRVDEGYLMVMGSKTKPLWQRFLFTKRFLFIKNLLLGETGKLYGDRNNVDVVLNYIPQSWREWFNYRRLYE